jgi:hypothetical protein
MYTYTVFRKSDSSENKKPHDTWNKGAKHLHTKLVLKGGNINTKITGTRCKSTFPT